MCIFLLIFLQIGPWAFFFRLCPAIGSLIIMCFLSFVADKPLGFTVMGGFMFARGVGREHWDEVMKNQKTHIQKWHKLQVSIDNLLDYYVLAIAIS